MADIKVSPMSGTGDGTDKKFRVEVKVDENEAKRPLTYKINVKGCDGMYTKQVNVTQGASNIQVIPEFDYLVIRYWWGKVNDSSLDPETQDYINSLNPTGVDYDSATAFINTGLSSSSGPIDNVYVGWSMPATSATVTVGDAPDYYMEWGRDNQAGGKEAVLLSMNNLLKGHESTLPDVIRINVKGNWYGTRGTGKVYITFTAYLGGTMALDKPTYNFINTGGSQVYIGKAVADVSAVGQTNYQNNFSKYSDVAVISYDKTTHAGTIETV